MSAPHFSPPLCLCLVMSSHPFCILPLPPSPHTYTHTHILQPSHTHTHTHLSHTPHLLSSHTHSQLPWLEELYAYGNRISYLPHELSSLKKLRTLAINENLLSGLPGAPTVTVTLTQSHSHCHTPTVTFPQSHSHSHTHTVTLPQSHSHSHTHTVTLPLSHSHSHTPTVTLPQSHSPNVTLPLSPSHSHPPHSHTHPPHCHSHRPLYTVSVLNFRGYIHSWLLSLLSCPPQFRAVTSSAGCLQPMFVPWKHIHLFSIDAKNSYWSWVNNPHGNLIARNSKLATFLEYAEPCLPKNLRICPGRISPWMPVIVWRLFWRKRQIEVQLSLWTLVRCSH